MMEEMCTFHDTVWLRQPRTTSNYVISLYPRRAQPKQLHDVIISDIVYPGGVRAIISDMTSFIQGRARTRSNLPYIYILQSGIIYNTVTTYNYYSHVQLPSATASQYGTVRVPSTSLHVD